MTKVFSTQNTPRSNSSVKKFVKIVREKKNVEKDALKLIDKAIVSATVQMKQLKRMKKDVLKKK